MPSSASRIIVAVLGIAFFATPIGLRAVGVTAHPFENRALARAPKLSQGFDAFNQTTRFFVDRMPLREQAVRANTWLSRHIFDTTPRYGQGSFAEAGGSGLPFGQPLGSRPAAPRRAANQPSPSGNQAVVGRDGWLYLQGELDRLCYQFVPYTEALAEWERLAAVVGASGRRAVVIVVPDKSSVFPEHLPASFAKKQCSEQNRRMLWGLLEQAGGQGVVGLRAKLLAAKRSAGEALYRRTDSHWTTVGSLAMVDAVLARVGGGVREQASEVVDPGPVDYTGDLTTLLGSREPDREQRREIRRRRGAQRVPGRTLLVKDSYGDLAVPQLAPYFAQLDAIDWVGSSPSAIADAVARSRTVIFETVEREFDYRAFALGEAGPPLLAALRSRLGR
jgi:hypothetical protein